MSQTAQFGGEMVENTENIACKVSRFFYIFVYARKKLPFLPRKYIYMITGVMSLFIVIACYSANDLG